MSNKRAPHKIAQQPSSLEQGLLDLNHNLKWSKNREDDVYQQLLIKIERHNKKQSWINKFKLASYSLAIASLLCIIFNLFIYDFLSLHSQPIIQHGKSLLRIPIIDELEQPPEQINKQNLEQLHSEIDRALDKIRHAENALLSSNPYHYLEESEEEYYFLLSLAEITLNKFLHDFESSSGNGLEHYIMAIICEQILGEHSLKESNKIYTGRDWYEQYKYEVMYNDSFEAPFSIDWYQMISNISLEKP